MNIEQALVMVVGIVTLPLLLPLLPQIRQTSSRLIMEGCPGVVQIRAQRTLTNPILWEIWEARYFWWDSNSVHYL